jgi:hypothetical protein
MITPQQMYEGLPSLKIDFGEVVGSACSGSGLAGEPAIADASEIATGRNAFPTKSEARGEAPDATCST